MSDTPAETPDTEPEQGPGDGDAPETPEETESGRVIDREIGSEDAPATN